MAVKEEIIRLLQEVEEGKYSNIALNELFHKKTFSAGEKKFITEVFYGVLRKKRYLDYMLVKRVEEVKKDWLRQLFRLSFYQICFMESDSKGVVWEGTELAKEKYGAVLSKFVNAVLRNFARSYEEDEKELLERGREDILWSYPKWFFKKMKKAFPEGYTEILQGLKEVPALSFRVNELDYSCEAFEKKLAAEKIDIIKKVGTVYYVKGNQLLHSPEFKAGLIIVQDAASYLAAKNLGAKAGETVLDACSAPGGKTVVLAECMENKGKVLALDVHEHKMRLIKGNCDKMGFDIVECMALDARKIDSLGRSFDRILVDAPCSGFGVLRKKPEGLYTKTAESISGLVELQKEILEAAWKVLSPGGVMLYSTCTILPEENEEQAAAFLERHEDAKVLPLELPENVKGHGDGLGGFSIDYQEKTLDSFYMIKMEKLKK